MFITVEPYALSALRPENTHILVSRSWTRAFGPFALWLWHTKSALCDVIISSVLDPAFA